MEGSDQLESCVKCHRVKCRSVEPWDINLRGVTNGIRAGLSPSTVWFGDEPGGSWWACNSPSEHTRMRGIQRPYNCEIIWLRIA